MTTDRHLHPIILDDALADRKMAFISGPRQVGKTWLAKRCLTSPANYFSWDAVEFKRAWIRSPLGAIGSIGPGPVVFDELHKYPHWKNSLKRDHPWLDARPGAPVHKRPCPQRRAQRSMNVTAAPGGRQRPSYQSLKERPSWKPSLTQRPVPPSPPP